MDLDQHILRILAAEPARGRPVTIGDFARHFGVSPVVVLPAAHRLVESGLAAPSMVVVHGVPTLRGLLPVSSSERAT